MFLERNLRWKFLTSDRVGTFRSVPWLKLRGKNSNWNTVKQKAENGQKTWSEDASGVTSLAGCLAPGIQSCGMVFNMITRLGFRHWCKASKSQGCGMVLNSTGRKPLQRHVTYELIPADHEHFESLIWPCVIARWHHWRHKRSQVPFFSLSV